MVMNMLICYKSGRMVLYENVDFDKARVYAKKLIANDVDREIAYISFHDTVPVHAFNGTWVSAS